MSSAAVVAVCVAFLGGLASFASPCLLPLVPAYVGYVVGTTNERSTGRERVAAFRLALAFSIGFSAVFVSMWASIGLVGYLLPGYAPLMRQAGGAVLVFLGLHVAGVISVSALYRDMRLPVGPFSRTRTLGERRDRASASQSALLGVVFAAGWTPCVGPILGGIIGLASASESVGQGAALLLAYAAGLAVPFILVAVGATSLTARLRWVRGHQRAVSVVTGALLAGVGLLMITNTFGRLAALAPSLPVA